MTPREKREDVEQQKVQKLKCEIDDTIMRMEMEIQTGTTAIGLVLYPFLWIVLKGLRWCCVAMGAR